MASYNLVQCVFDRTGLSPNEDVGVITMHIREVVAGAPDIIPITDNGRDEFVGNIASWWGIAKGHVSSKIKFQEIRFYDVPSVAGQDMGPPVKVQPVAEFGTATGQVLPPQCAISHTFRTDKRATWGRFYLPSPTTALLDAFGRLFSGAADELLGAAHLLTSRSGTGGALTVFSRKEWTHHDPQLIQIDDIIDVIRTRRFKEPHYRKTLSAG